ncbi:MULTISPECIES: hypothetical protein [unclassified Brevundimonas]|uniref:hypothetical protein n=1 Tax=unclassified Brevundimonas TaxID=2622653 RepID=UPI001A352086|nr:MULTISPECIES: hypothetical protein [unclassified Brevundimonas]MBJ7484613.1 hypothetical protein [Brevundimonas sp.]WGM47872.1 hypothetical protein KOAAANKH_02757 [Brevundimonas sp. NIBR10]
MTKTLAAFAALALVAAPLTSATSAAVAQTAPAPAPLTVNSPIKALLANPATKAILDKHLPGLANHPALPQFQDMTLTQVMPMSQGAVTAEIIAAIDTDIKALPAR